MKKKQSKPKRRPITPETYDQLMDSIIAKGKPFDQTLSDMLTAASMYRIKEKKACASK